MRYLLLLLLGLWAILLQAAYQPQLMLTLSAHTLNQQINTRFGENITQAINNVTLPDQNISQKVQGVNLRLNLTHLKQHIQINWQGNTLKILNTHAFSIASKNVNLTLNGTLDAKIGPTRRQKGPLKVQIQHIDTTTNIQFIHNQCKDSVGFNAQITNIDLHTGSVVIKIEGHAFDNLVIKEVERFLLPRIPQILNKAATQRINPLISQATCNRPQQTVQLGDQMYVAIFNTTKVPEFNEGLKYLRAPLDLTFQNQLTNATHQQLERDDLPLDKPFQDQVDASVALSSNFLNMVTWLVDNANLLKLKVTNQMLGPDPPIALNTTNLSILLPQLKKWPAKEVFLLIEPSVDYEHLLMRSGRLVTAMSLSVKFVVNLTNNQMDTNKAIQQEKYIVACDLNLTLSASLILKINQQIVHGLIHTLSIYQVGVIDALIDVNTAALKNILNSLVGSFVSPINRQLSQEGIELPQSILELLAKFDINDIRMQTFKDFTGVGLTFDV